MLSTKEKYTKASLRVCLKAFPMRFKNMPTKRALEVLIELGCSNECLWWLSYEDAAKRHEWSIKRFSESGTIVDAFPLARHITQLEFYGGPPMALEFHKGTLLSLLMDRLLCAMDDGGFKALDAVIPLSESYTACGGRWI